MKIDVQAAIAAWSSLSSALGTALSAEHTPRNARRMMNLLDEFMSVADQGSGAVRDSLVEFLTQWVEAYEERSLPVAEMHPRELLQHLMEQNGLKQCDLAQEMGGQSAVSLVLRGKRNISLRQARKLAARFGLSLTAFIEPDSPFVLMHSAQGSADEVREIEGVVTVSGPIERRFEADTFSGKQYVQAFTTH